MYRKNKPTKPGGSIDRGLLWLTIFLVVIGTLAVSDASAPQALAAFGNPYYFARQQLVWAAIGLVGMIVASKIHYLKWKQVGFIVGAVGVFLLVIVLIPGIGSKVLGARRWINLGPMALQPSEVAKFTLAVVMAKLLDERYHIKYAIGFIGGIALLVMLQPDLGTTLVIAGVGLAQLFAGGVPLLQMAVVVGSGAISTLLLILTSDYRRARLMTYLESSHDPLGNSYHMKQILIALGSGGLFGVGVGQSRQKHLFLPESASDSVFAVIAEETGFVGAFFVIVILTFFILRILKVANNAPDNFSKLLAFGIAVWFGAQMFLNISSVVAFTPLTGIPLPFFSYGGSSLVMILSGVGIILNISKYAKNKG